MRDLRKEQSLSLSPVDAESLTRCEELLLQSIEELRNSALISVSKDEVDVESNGDPSFRFSRLSSHWYGTGEAEGLGGEFRIPQLYRAIAKPPPLLAWDGAPDDERELIHESREIDGTPRSGTGVVVTVRLSTSLEIWLWYRGQPMQMDVDYLGYLKALALTKGTHGWQYLFTDLNFADPDLYWTAGDMKAMLHHLPGLFPQYDYTSLRERLDDRL
ncbi:hypothetical protein ACIBO2_18640 [Nonomuraea sp. NPDC050022]|uniref:hypothetical protein n=1 Tax=Nonomuraea sp. NPDC050022 TaxID=3364358 RepID=UPI00379F913F